MAAHPFRVALVLMLIAPSYLLSRSLVRGPKEVDRGEVPLQLLRAGNAALVRDLQGRAAAAAAEGVRLAQVARASRAGMDKLPEGEAAELKDGIHAIRDDIAEVARAQAAGEGVGGLGGSRGGSAPGAGAVGGKGVRLVDYRGLSLCGAECQDRRAECGAWGSEGRCTTAHQYMSVMCALTCGSCQSCRRTAPATAEGVGRAIVRRDGGRG